MNEVHDCYYGSNGDRTKATLRAGVYAIINIVNGKIYVGCSINIGRRVTVHFSDLKHGRHSNRYLQSSFRLHGTDSFQVAILEFVNDENLLKVAEQKWIDRYQACNKSVGFNIVPDSQHKRLSDETRRLMSVARTGRSLSETHKINIRLGNLGVPRPRSKKAPKPKVDQRETFAKISQSLKGHKVSAETRQAISRAKSGKPLAKRHVTTPAQRAEIIRLSIGGTNDSAISRQFAISRMTVRSIINGRYLYGGI